MEMEMEQLLGMGFPKELAAQALAATGGNSTLRATEWILSRPTKSSGNNHNNNNNINNNNNPNPSPPPPPPSKESHPNRHHSDIIHPSPPPPPYQPKLERFFCSQSKPDSFPPANPTSTAASTPQQQQQAEPPQRDDPSSLKQNEKGTITNDEDEGNNQVKRHMDASQDQESSKSGSKRPKLLASTTHNSRSPSLCNFINNNATTVIHQKSSSNDNNQPPSSVPLSERMRPRTIDDVVGQDHLLAAPNSLLRSAIRCNRLPSIILWGPPGTGKTSLARAIVNSLPAPPTPPSPQHSFSPSSSSFSLYRFVSLSAVTCGVKDVKDAVDDARKIKLKKTGKMTVLFVDEVHRFNKSQQDSFLPFIEDGSIVFMGATTENPSFHLITPLLSRCRVLTLSPLKPHHLRTILLRAIRDDEVGLSKSLELRVQVCDDAIQFLSTNSDGDARVALNALEISATTAASRLLNADLNSNTNIDTVVAIVGLDDAKEALQCKHLAYDRAGEEHYNLISALHKSMRGSDADASIYWLARMLQGGEQPLYIARRLIRFASEDVGLADPLALNQAVACYQACHFLGLPECNVILAQCVAYLALAPKSISVYRAIEAAQKAVRESVGENEGVPLHLRNAPTKLMKELGYGKGYIYTPEDPSSTQSYLPSSLQGYKFLDWPSRNTSNG